MRSALTGSALHAAIARVVATHLRGAPYRAWIIGSEASGHALPGADIDVAVEGGTLVPLELLAEIRDALDALPTVRPFDLVDLRRVTPRFRQEALREALPLVLEAAADVES